MTCLPPTILTPRHCGFRSVVTALWLLLAASCIACSGRDDGQLDDAGPPGVDAGAADAGPASAMHDAGGASDAGPSSPDAFVRDAGCSSDLFSDPNNCGACGRVCCSATCRAGVCLERTIDTGATSTAQLVHTSAVDDDALYVVGSGAGGAGVFKAPKSTGRGAALSPLYAHVSFTGLALSDTHVYFALRDTSSPNAGKVLRIAKSGGAPDELVSGLTGAIGLAVDATHVYYTTTDAVYRVATSGGEPSQLATYPTKVRYATSPTLVAVDATHVYYNVLSNDGALTGAVMKTPLAGGAPVTLAEGIARLTYIVDVAGTDVLARTDYDFFPGSGTYPRNSAILAIPKAGGMPRTLAADSSQSALSALASPIRVAPGAADVFYLTAFSVNRVPSSGGVYEVVYPVSGYEMSVDARCAYVVTGMPNVTVVTR